MRVRLTSPPVVGSLLGLSGILFLSPPGLLVATARQDDAKAGRPAKVRNESKPAQANPDRATAEKGTGPGSRPPNLKMAPTDALLRALDQEIPTKDLPHSFWPLLEYLTERTRATGTELPFFVDVRVFSNDVREVLDGRLPPPVFKAQPLPSRMSIRSIVQMALNEFDGGEATFLVRQGRVEITSKKAAALPNLLKQTLAASFDRQPLEFVLDDLSDITGVSVVVDGRAGDRIRTPITARFRNDVPVLDALRMVTESAGLKLVELPGGQDPTRALFVTTPEHARAMQR
jgi:hypothetical protein